MTLAFWFTTRIGSVNTVPPPWTSPGCMPTFFWRSFWILSAPTSRAGTRGRRVAADRSTAARGRSRARSSSCRRSSGTRVDPSGRDTSSRHGHLRRSWSLDVSGWTTGQVVGAPRRGGPIGSAAQGRSMGKSVRVCAPRLSSLGQSPRRPAPGPPPTSSGPQLPPGSSPSGRPPPDRRRVPLA